MTTRTKGPRCVTCSGQKCLHVNLYKEANEDPVVGRKSERQKERAKSVKTTAVVGDPKLPMEPSGEGREEEDEEHDEESVQSEFNPYLFKGKKSNVFGVTITYPPTDEEKDDIKRINTEDIFPDDLAAPSLEEGEECKHGNQVFSQTRSNKHREQKYDHSSFARHKRLQKQFFGPICTIY